MGNILGTFKRFFSNKNTVTIIGVLLGIVVLYVGYNYRVSNAIDTQMIPYAKETIPAATEIKQQAVGTTEVLRSLVTSNKTLISSMSAVIDQNVPKCVQIGNTIPQGAFFYRDQVADCRSIGRNALNNMPEGHKAVALSVNQLSTFGNSLMPNDYIDLYVNMRSDEGKIIYGEFITKLKILDVRDSSSKSLFYGEKNDGTPAILLFAVPQDLYLLISKANYVNGVTLVPVPGNSSYTATAGETKVQSEYLRDQILKYTQDIPDEVINDVY